MSTIDDIKSKIDCVEVAKRLSTVWETGRTWKFTYPKCNDGSSTFISADKKWWKIHSKQIGGDCINLYSFLKYGTTYEHSALSDMIRDFDLPNIDPPSAVDHSYEDTRRIFDIIQEYTNKGKDRAIPLLEGRGIPPKITEQYKVGYIGHDDARAMLTKMGDLRKAEEAGLMTSDGRFLLADRIVFPIFHKGRVVNLVGWKADAKPKYLFPRNGTRNRRAAYGLDSIHDQQMTARVLWIVEGVVDALSVLSAGFPACAVLSNSVDDTMLSDIVAEARNTPVKIALDYDKASGAGQRGTLKLLCKLLEARIPCSVIRLSPDLFYEGKASEGRNLPSTMERRKIVRMFQNEKQVKDLLKDWRLEFEKGAVETNVPALFDKLVKHGATPMGDDAVTPRGLLWEHANTFRAEACDKDGICHKLDINDVWRITRGDKKALQSLAETAINPLYAYLSAITEGKMDCNTSQDRYILANAEYRPFAKYINVLTAKEGLAMFGLTDAQITQIISPKAQSEIVTYAQNAMSRGIYKFSEAIGLVRYDSQEGYYTSCSHYEFGEYLRKEIVPQHESVVDDRLVEKITEEIKMNCRIKDSQKMLKESMDFLTLEHGTYEIINKRYVPSFSEHNLSMCKVHIDYDANADCPHFKKVLREILVTPEEEEMEKFSGNDNLSKEIENRIEYAREMLGLFIVPDNTFQKIWFWRGGGSNGKSVLQRLMEMLIGESRISHYALIDFAEKIMIASLAHKLLNLSGDEQATRIKSEAWRVVKCITGGDTITGRGHYEEPKDLALSCRLVCNVNEMPKIPDSSYAVERRVEILDFPVRFVRKSDYDSLSDKKKREMRVMIPDIHKTFIPELAGIFNWLIQGYHNLKERGEMRELTSTKAALNERIEGSDLAVFFDEQIEECTLGEVKLLDLRKRYVAAGGRERDDRFRNAIRSLIDTRLKEGVSRIDIEQRSREKHKPYYILNAKFKRPDTVPIPAYRNNYQEEREDD